MNINAPLSIRRRMGLEIFRRLENERTEEHQLKQLFWECTLRCNLHCRHCGSDCKKIAGHPDMPKEDFLRVLDSVSAQMIRINLCDYYWWGTLMRKDRGRVWACYL